VDFLLSDPFEGDLAEMPFAAGLRNQSTIEISLSAFYGSGLAVAELPRLPYRRTSATDFPLSVGDTRYRS